MMLHAPALATLLVADDDEEDRALTTKAAAAAALPCALRFVTDGDALMDYLHRRGAYGEPGSAPHPDLILLDLRMPGRDGFSCLEEIKSHPELRSIPIVVLSTSRDGEEVSQCYGLGSNSFVRKPATFGALVAVMEMLGRYWGETVELPGEQDDAF